MSEALMDDFTDLTADAATVQRLLASDPLDLGGAADTLRRERHGDQALLTRVRVLRWDEMPGPEDHPALLPGRTADTPDEIRIEGAPPSDVAALSDVLRSVVALHPGVPVRALRPCEAVSLALAAGTSPLELLLVLVDAGLSRLHFPLASDQWEATMAGLLAACGASMTIELPLPWDGSTDAEALCERIADLAALVNEGVEPVAVVPLPAGGAEVSPLEGTTGLTDLRLFAALRLLFPTVPHIVVEATVVGPKLGAIALSFGADALAGALTVPTTRIPAKDAEKPRPFNGDRARALLAECGRTVVFPAR